MVVVVSALPIDSQLNEDFRKFFFEESQLNEDFRKFFFEEQ